MERRIRHFKAAYPEKFRKIHSKLTAQAVQAVEEVADKHDAEMRLNNGYPEISWAPTAQQWQQANSESKHAVERITQYVAVEVWIQDIIEEVQNGGQKAM